MTAPATLGTLASLLATGGQLFDPVSFALVAGGSVIVAACHGTLDDLGRACGALRVVRRGKTFDAAIARADLARLERVARRSGVLAMEHETVEDPTVRRAVIAIVDGAGPIETRALLERERDRRTARHVVAQDFWTTVAEVAPGMGMIGTIIGLVGMFASMDDPAGIGGSMSLALLTTLYGAVIANLIAAPIAGKLRRQANREEEARAAIEAPLCALAERFVPLAPSLRAPRVAVA